MGGQLEEDSLLDGYGLDPDAADDIAVAADVIDGSTNVFVGVVGLAKQAEAGAVAVDKPPVERHAGRDIAADAGESGVGFGVLRHGLTLW